jgi:para-nitrobenzyl esterase
MLLNANPASSYASPVWALIAVDSDVPVGGSCSYREVARAAAGPNGKPVFRYLYTHAFEADSNLTPYQAFHAAEFPFVTGDPSIGDGAGNGHATTSAETMLAAQMMGYWTRFATTGDPNGSGASRWPPYNATADPMLQIDDVSVQINGYRTQQCDFYDANSAALSNVQ